MTANPQRPRHARERDDAFRILIVSTGDICRSPLAVQLFLARLPAAFAHHDTTAIEVSSAGTVAIDGHTMEPAAANEATRLGVVDAPEHRARRLQPEHIESADLVIAMTREHRAAVVKAVPRARRRTFTLIELTRTLEAVAGGGAPVRPDAIGDGSLTEFLRSAIDAAEACRIKPPRKGRELDIEDPYRRKAAVYRRSADAVAQQVDRMLAAMQSLADAEPADVSGTPA